MTELLAPAGNLEKLKIAFDYGADAVYIGGTAFGLRSKAGNFSLEEIQEGLEYAHNKKGKVYVVLNILAHHEDIDQVIPYLHTLNEIKPDGFIIADPGLIALAKQHTDIEVHLSTQASVTNIESVKFWIQQGITRVVLAREISLAEAKQIKEAVNVELEMFIHGSMCNSYSGKCLISNYTNQRDANRGGCVQSCRFKYHLLDDSANVEQKSHILNSRDLQALSLIPTFIDAGIDSLKIEGRMKSNMYLANTVAVYRKIIDHYTTHKSLDGLDMEELNIQIQKISNRTFSTGFLTEGFRTNEMHDQIMRPDTSEYFSSMEFIGTVKETLPEDSFLVEVAAPFSPGDPIEYLMQDGSIVKQKIQSIKNLVGMNVEKTKPNTVVILPWIPGIEKNTVLRREKMEV